MRRRRNSDAVVDLVIVETPDGTRLRCSVAGLGGERPHWSILDSTGAQHVGPPADHHHTADAARELIQRWWSERHPSQPSERDAAPGHA